jgi:hypothetical protein
MSQIPPELTGQDLHAASGTNNPEVTITADGSPEGGGLETDASSSMRFARRLADACLRASPTTQSLMECLDWHVLAFGRCALVFFQAETPLPKVIRAILALSALSAVSYGACRLWLP